MKVKRLHDWKLSPGEAVRLQRKLAGRVRLAHNLGTRARLEAEGGK